MFDYENGVEIEVLYSVLIYVLASLCVFMITLNIISFIRMYKILGKIKFENYVILSGIIEAIILLAALISQVEAIIEIINFFELIIELFISRRFLRIYYKLNEKENKNSYKVFFGFFFSINICFILIFLSFFLHRLIFPDKDSISNAGIDYTQMSHICFGFFSAIILFKIGHDIKEMIYKSYKELNEGSVIYKNIPNTSATISMDDEPRQSLLKSRIQLTEKCMSLRVKQINLIIFPFILSDCYRIIYVFLRNYLLFDDFDFSYSTIVPTTITTSILHFLYIFSFILIAFTNYLAFYHLVKRHFESKNVVSRLSADDIVIKVDDSKQVIKNKEIEDFFQSFRKK